MKMKIVLMTILMIMMVVPAVAADDISAYKDENIHAGALIGMLIFISWLMFLYIRNDKFILTGILAGILMIIMAAMLFNTIYYDVCEADVTTTSHYCGQETFTIPYIFKWALQVLFLIIGFGFILDAIMIKGEKQPGMPEHTDIEDMRRRIRQR